MSTIKRFKVNKEILHWAVKESQKENEEIINKFPKFQDWLDGVTYPTFKQLHDLANYLKIPLGYLFLKTPPKINVMRAEFRSINNKHPDMSKNLKDTIAMMDNRRSWMSDYRKDIGWGKLEIIEHFGKDKTGEREHDARLIKRILELEETWYLEVRDYEEAYNFLKNTMEEKGILVMQNGVVGNNNRRKLDINEFRAFMLYDDLAPLIFININDSQGGKIFSLIHELIHILNKQENIFLTDDIYSDKENERHINRLTSEILMPKKYLESGWDKSKDTFEQIKQLAKELKVSETALAIKLKEMNYIDKDTLGKVINVAIEHFEFQVRRRSGGNFYNTFNTRISPTFTQAVIRSAETGNIDYTYAFRLLGGIKGKTYDEIRERTLPYG